jgi:hypothetical protein
MTPRRAGVGLTEVLKDMRKEIGRDAGAGVGHRDGDFVLELRDRHVDMTARRRELNGSTTARKGVPTTRVSPGPFNASRTTRNDHKSAARRAPMMSKRQW